MRLVTPRQMKLLEGLTSQSGVSYQEMMERAGVALSVAIAKHFPECKKVLFLAGNGNNGGDCYVAAYHLKQAGCMPEILAPCGEPRTKIAKDARDRAKAAGIPVFAGGPAFLFTEAELIVDGLYGTGFRGELPEQIRELLTHAKGKPCVACDIPSGGNGASGSVSDGTLKAALTVTFGAEKLGMRQFPLCEYCGEIVLADIGIPENAFDEIDPPAAEVLDIENMRRLLPELRKDAHKYSRGHLLAIAGSVKMRGACVLSVTAAMRSGVGLVTCASAEPALAAICNRTPEVMNLPMKTDAEGYLSYTANRLELEVALEGKQALLLGCGLGVTEETSALTEFLLKKSTCPVILDADGLNAASTCIEWIPKGRTILTPHPGEAARLLDCTTAEVQNDRPGTAAALAEKTGAVVVLKGAGTLITDGRRTAYCGMGNPGMAKAGSGDVLAGIAASFAAQGMPLYEAACAAVTLHAAAGDLVAGQMPERFMLPQDIIFALRELL